MAKRILIAYFSRPGENLVDDQVVDIGPVGNTKRAAELLQAALKEKGMDADLYEIKTIVPYSASYQECMLRAKEEKTNDLRPAIEEGPVKFDFYDIAFLGYPNWWGTCPMPVLSFCKNHVWDGKMLLPFVTHGGQLFLYSVDAIRQEAKNAEVIESFAIAASYMETAKSVVDNWVNDYQMILGD